MAVGWKLLRSGQAYYGTIHDGDTVIDAPPAATPPSGPDLPAKSALKDDWVHAALGFGLEPGGLTKDEVIALVEKHVDAGEDGSAVGGEVAGVELGADTEQPGAGPGQEDEA